jgi:hypothetical protein
MRNRRRGRPVGDPRWITARYKGACADCRAEIPAGAQAFYYPTSGSLFGKDCGCGERRQAEFDAAIFDETNNASM